MERAVCAGAKWRRREGEGGARETDTGSEYVWRVLYFSKRFGCFANPESCQVARRGTGCGWLSSGDCSTRQQNTAWPLYRWVTQSLFACTQAALVQPNGLLHTAGGARRAQAVLAGATSCVLPAARAMRASAHHWSKGGSNCWSKGGSNCCKGRRLRPGCLQRNAFAHPPIHTRPGITSSWYPVFNSNPILHHLPGYSGILHCNFSLMPLHKRDILNHLKWLHAIMH